MRLTDKLSIYEFDSGSPSALSVAAAHASEAQTCSVAGGWAWPLGDVRRVVYRLPDLKNRSTIPICDPSDRRLVQPRLSGDDVLYWRSDI